MPPFVIAAVKLTVLDAHTEFASAVTVIVGVTTGNTLTIIVLLVSFLGTAQKALEFKIHLTTSPANKLELLKVAPVAVFTPFTCHW